MNEALRKELSRIFSGKIRFDCGMDRFTTFRVGGKADAVCFPDDIEGLKQLVLFINREAISSLVVGKGSNLLVRDGGFKGIVIVLSGMFASIEKDKAGENLVKMGAGASIADLLSFCSRLGLSGIEFLAGIPGTVGGAVAMNAGAFGKEICSVIQDVQFMTNRGDLTSKERSRLNYSYRKLNFSPGETIVSARIELKKEKPEVVKEKVFKNLKKRKNTQPLDMPSAGSIFKNPSGDYAARLIEEAGLKGKRSGGAMVSRKHANFIVNTGDAKAKDILNLIYLVRDEVRELSGVDLEPEIHIVGISL